MKSKLYLLFLFLILIIGESYSQGQASKMERYIWEEASEVWTLQNWVEYTYHPDGQVAFEYYYTGNEPNFRTSIYYEYDAVGRLIFEEEKETPPPLSNLYTIRRKHFTYEEGNLVQKEESTTIMTLNEGDRRDFYGERNTFTYNENNCLINELKEYSLFYVQEDSVAWFNNTNIISYLQEENCVVDSLDRLNEVGSAMDNYRERNEYNASNQLIKKGSYQLFSTTGDLLLLEEKVYSYNAKNQLTSVQQTQSNFGGLFRTLYEYDEDGNQVKLREEIQNNQGNWRLRRELVEGYTPKKDLEFSSDYFNLATFFNQPGEYFNQSSYEYNYDDQLIEVHSILQQNANDSIQSLQEWQEKLTYRCDGNLQEHLYLLLEEKEGASSDDDLITHFKEIYYYDEPAPCEEFTIPDGDGILYPNPSEEEINIKDHLLADPLTRIEIYTISGQMLHWEYSNLNESQDITIVRFSPGTYVLRVIGKEATNHYKFVKMN